MMWQFEDASCGLSCLTKGAVGRRSKVLAWRFSVENNTYLTERGERLFYGRQLLPMIKSGMVSHMFTHCTLLIYVGKSMATLYVCTCCFLLI